MKRQLVLALLALGATCAARAQETVPNSPEVRNVAASFSVLPDVNSSYGQPFPTSLFQPTSTTSSTPAALSPAEDTFPEASPAPPPDPRFLYGGRDDFRWQLGIGVDWIRFRSSVFNASAIGVKTSVTYFTNDWFGVEGSVSAGFAPTILANEHVKILVYTVGPKIAWREKKWEPWVHALIGGAHEQPQTAGNGRNSFAVEAGGGADYRFNPRLSGRLEADLVHTRFFSQSQNNFELMAGVVFHF